MYCYIYYNLPKKKSNNNNNYMLFMDLCYINNELKI